MKASAPLAFIGSLAAAASFEDRTLQNVNYLPTYSNPSHTRAQFPVFCPSCFSNPNITSLTDGYLLFSLQLTRHWGIDGPDGCLLNGHLTYESAFELNPNGYTPFSPSSYTADRLFVPLNSDSAQVDIKGTATYYTLVSNAAHDIKGMRFELQGVRNWPSGLLAQPTRNTGFTLSYSRRPVPQILRLSQEPSSDAFSPGNVELWTNPGPGQRWQDLAHAPLDTRHDYGGVDYYWLECESIACRVNRVWELMRKAYAECRERVEEPDLYAGEEEGGMPLHCRVYLADPTVAAYGGLALLLIMVVGLRYCTNRFRRRKRVDVEGVHRGRYEMRGKEKN